MALKRFYNLHVFITRNDGFSKLVEIESKNRLTDDEVIEYAVENDIISDEDALMVDYVEELTEEEVQVCKFVGFF